MKKFEIETIFDSHSESHYTSNRKQAMKVFEEQKEKFTNDETIKRISLNLVSLIDDDLKKEPIEKIERRQSND